MNHIVPNLFRVIRLSSGDGAVASVHSHLGKWQLLSGEAEDDLRSPLLPLSSIIALKRDEMPKDVFVDGVISALKVRAVSTTRVNQPQEASTPEWF